MRSTADSRMFADFARKSMAVCVSSIKVVSEMSPFGAWRRGHGGHLFYDRT